MVVQCSSQHETWLSSPDNPLASGFSILDGRHEITVPSVASGSDYAIVREYCARLLPRQWSHTLLVFGDSGNASPDFTITN